MAGGLRSVWLAGDKGLDVDIGDAERGEGGARRGLYGELAGGRSSRGARGSGFEE